MALRTPLILRKPRSGCLEERTTLIQPIVHSWNQYRSSLRHSPHGGIAARRQYLKERLQMPGVMPPAPDRAVEDRLPHLPETGRENRPLGAMELEAAGFPVETEEFDQAPANR